LFDSDKKAETFIKFNKDEILAEGGYRPQRAYFCSFCGGWHVTSIQEEIPKTKREEMLENLIKLREKEKFQKEVNKAKRNNGKGTTSGLKAESEEFFQKVTHELDALNVQQRTDMVLGKIQELKDQIQKLAGPNEPVNHDELKRLRIDLELWCVAKKQYHIKELKPAKNNINTKEWEEWMNKHGYKL
jgi:hypothetical protein